MMTKVTRVTAFKTSDNKLFELEYTAQNHQAAIDKSASIKDWILKYLQADADSEESLEATPKLTWNTVQDAPTTWQEVAHIIEHFSDDLIRALGINITSLPKKNK